MSTRRPLLIAFLILSQWASAHEGMWLPTLLKGIEGDMHTAGLRITAEDIYSINNGSIKDAIVHFGGGCTAEVISKQGLILTNHHCGFSAIQEQSSLENDYLKNGFWAKDKAGELRNPGLTATFIIRMEDVTDRIIPNIPAEAGATEAQRREAVGKLGEAIAKEAIAGTHFQAVVRPFNYGNSYFLIVTETFRDVRLVGAPPSAIGKFGGDTDNWMWPRHTGDFSIFRIYAGPDNKPAEPSDANVPFIPRHSLPVNIAGVNEGDFAMIFGFPGSTQRYLSSYAVDYVLNTADPLRIKMRSASLDVIDAAMRSNDKTRIQYADKQASISNAWKKWIGEVRGLKELRTLDRKREQEALYLDRALKLGRTDLQEVLPTLKDLYTEYVPLATARDLFVEMVYYGPEILRFADGFRELTEEHLRLVSEGKFDAKAAERLAALPGFFKDYDVEVDKRVFKALLPIYRASVPVSGQPAVLKEIDTRFKGDSDAWVDDLYTRSVLVNEASAAAALKLKPKKYAKLLANDPVYKASRSFFKSFLEQVRPQHAALSDRIETAMRTYVKGMMEMEPDRTFWPDANSTLRLSYGKVEGSAPRDGVVYGAHTTLDGVVEKYIPGDAEFDVPKRLLELQATKDFGEYGVNGTMPVCFTSSLHTTGGNSGSPVLNAKGELIGLNFDRTWESTMSDIQFDPDKCRNVCVDTRYILFVVDKFAGAKHLVDEMELVRTNASAAIPGIIQLPIHR
ncbi:MAG: S46 family peptidase [Flavobacteriales bacterium]|nr:S46 family peptidase [Flavobacteriales bacterium]